VAEERLQKILSTAGVASRRKSETLILEGRVTVNGKVVTELGSKADFSKDHIKVDGRLIHEPTQLLYIALNKPDNVVSTASDPQRRTTVLDLVQGLRARVYPVGRLDYHSEGLLLLTNDGELGNRLIHPSGGVPKTYLAEVEGVPSAAAVRRLREGIELDDGWTAPARARRLRPTQGGDWIAITIHEGRNRQVRRMCDAIGHPVRRLIRTRFGPLADARLAPGQWRPLRMAEVRALFKAVTPTPPE